MSIMAGTCSAHGTIACHRQQPDGTTRCSFSQSAPADGTLIEGDRKTRVLVYRAPDGSIVVCPNIHYNQPIAWRVDHLLWCAQRDRERGHELRRSADRIKQSLGEDMLTQATRLEQMAADLEAPA